MANISGASGAAPLNPQFSAPEAAQNTAKEITQAKQEMTDQLMDLKEEMGGKETLVKNKETKTETQTRLDQAQEGARPEFNHGEMDEAAAQAAALAGQDEVDKLKKKKRKKEKDKKFEKTLAELAGLTESFDIDQLTDEEKEVVEEFKQNLGTINRFKRQLKDLDDQEIHFKGILEQQKKRPRR